MKKVTITIENIKNTKRYISKQGIMYESNPDYSGYIVSGCIDADLGAVIVHIEKPTFKESIFDLYRIQDKEEIDDLKEKIEARKENKEVMLYKQSKAYDAMTRFLTYQLNEKIKKLNDKY